MLSLPEDAATRVQRERDKDRGEVGEMTTVMIGLRIVIKLKTIQAIIFFVFDIY